MPLPIEMQKLMRVAEVITDGDISSVNLTCPYCNNHSLIFSFTVIEPPRHGLFIVCTECKHRQHFSYGEKPRNFRDDLVLARFQKLEDEAHEFAIEIVRKKKQDQSS